MRESERCFGGYRMKGKIREMPDRKKVWLDEGLIRVEGPKLVGEGGCSRRPRTDYKVIGSRLEDEE